MTDPRTDPCRSGQSPAEIARLAAGDLEAADSERTRAHLRACSACAAVYFQHVRLRTRVRSLVDRGEHLGIDGAGTSSVSAHWSRLGQRLLGRPLRAAAAFLVVGIFLGLGGLAIGNFWSRGSPPTVALGDGVTVAQWAAAGIDLVPTGASGTDVVTHHRPMTDAEGASLRLFAIEDQSAQRCNLLALDADGGVRWNARSSWPDWRMTIGHAGVRIATIEPVRLAESGGAADWAIGLVASRQSRTLFLAIDAGTGAVRFRAFVETGGAPAVSEFAAISPLPPDASGRRPWIFGGSHGPRALPAPELVVFAPDGSPRQRVALPSLAPGGARGNRVRQVLVASDGRATQVDAHSSEGLVFQFDYIDGRLDISSVTVNSNAGDLSRLREQVGAERYDAFLARFGGPQSWRIGVAGAVEELPVGDRLRRWDD